MVLVPAINNSYVILLEGAKITQVAVQLPQGAVAIFCKSIGELLERAERMHPRCIILDRTAVADLEALARDLRRMTESETIVAVVGRSEVPPEIDVRLDAGPDLQGEIARLVRFSLGQNVRSGARVRSAGRAVLEMPGRPVIVEAEVVDLSEEGVRLQGEGLQVEGIVTMKLLLVNGMEIVVEANPIRIGPDSVAYQFSDLLPRSRVLLRTFLLRHGAVDPTPVPLPTRAPFSSDLRDILDFCEREIVRRMLDRHSGNRTRTAKALGISRQALQQKLARFRNQAQKSA